MRIAIDIDSTLHHYWDRLSDSALRRFGIELPYEEQFTWGITRLKPQQLQVCIDDTHSEAEILASTPYDGRRRRRQRLVRRRALHPHHQPSRRALPRLDAALARADRPAPPRPALLLRQGRPLPRARHRPADRRQPGQHRAGARGRDRDRHDPAPVERGGLRDRGRRQRRHLAGAGDPPRAGPGRPRPRIGRRLMAPADRTPLRDAAAAAPDDGLELAPPPGRRARAQRTCATCCRASSRSVRSTTGAARSASRAPWTRRSSSSSTGCGSAARSRGSRTSPPTAARWSSPTTRGRCRPTPR